MRIKQFVKASEGEWKSMRSSHSLAFKQFEEVLSKIKIILLKDNDQRINNLLLNTLFCLLFFVISKKMLFFKLRSLKFSL